MADSSNWPNGDCKFLPPSAARARTRPSWAKAEKSAGGFVAGTAITTRHSGPNGGSLLISTPRRRGIQRFPRAQTDAHLILLRDRRARSGNPSRRSAALRPPGNDWLLLWTRNEIRSPDRKTHPPVGHGNTSPRSCLSLCRSTSTSTSTAALPRYRCSSNRFAIAMRFRARYTFSRFWRSASPRSGLSGAGRANGARLPDASTSWSLSFSRRISQSACRSVVHYLNQPLLLAGEGLQGLQQLLARCGLAFRDLNGHFEPPQSVIDEYRPAGGEGRQVLHQRRILVGARLHRRVERRISPTRTCPSSFGSLSVPAGEYTARTLPVVSPYRSPALTL